MNNNIEQEEQEEQHVLLHQIPEQTALEGMTDTSSRNPCILVRNRYTRHRHNPTRNFKAVEMFLLANDLSKGANLALAHYPHTDRIISSPHPTQPTPVCNLQSIRI